MNKNDLAQIGQLIDERLEKVFDERLDKAFDKRLTPIEKELKRHGKLLRALKRDQDTMLDMLDGEQMKQSKRLARVEEHLGISTN